MESGQPFWLPFVAFFGSLTRGIFSTPILRHPHTFSRRLRIGTTPGIVTIDTIPPAPGAGAGANPAGKTITLMSYTYKMNNGQQLLVDQDGDQTRLALSHDSSSQQQSQGTAFDTGTWTNPPKLFRLQQALILRVEAKNGSRFIRVQGEDIQWMNNEPDLGQAEPLKLSESDQPAGMKPMEPMKPMKPMGS
jgi:hypothetical protein